MVFCKVLRRCSTANQFLIRARKAKPAYQLQRTFGQAVAEKINQMAPNEVTTSISASYAQKKASLWESQQLIPTQLEMRAISELLDVNLKDLEESFSGVAPASAADVIQSMAEIAGRCLIATCFTGRVRLPLPEMKEALRKAIKAGVQLAIFFPFPRDLRSSAKSKYAEPLMHQHRDAWRSIVEYWKVLRSFAPESSSTVKLYRPTTESANILFPPMFHRSTLLCERTEGVTKVELYTWTQGEKSDGFFTVAGRSLEDADMQIDRWKLFFGDILERWSETSELPEADAYWQSFDPQTDSEVA